MEPLTAVGLATNVAQLVELSLKIITKSRSLYQLGVLPEHRDTETVTNDLRRINESVLGYLHESKDDEGLSEDDKALRHLCESSNRIATQLIERLASIKPGGKKRGWKSLRQALKSVWIKSDLDETAARLQAYRLQLNTRILVGVRNKLEQLSQSNERIATDLLENRTVSSTSQENQTQYLTKVITSQHGQTRELLKSLRLEPQANPPLVITAPNDVQHEFQSPIFNAIQQKSIDKLRQVHLTDPSAVFSLNKIKQTPLHLASQVDDEELIEYLIRSGAQINPEDENGNLPIHYAARSGSLATVRALLFRGADTQAKDNEGHTARDLCEPDSLGSWMMEWGPNVQAKNNDGVTALHHFTQNRNCEAVRALLKLGADVETLNNLQQTPMFLAAETDHVEMIELLLSFGASVNKEDYRRDTALLRAGWYGHTRACTVLLQAGAKIEAKNIFGFTALDECCSHGRIETGRLLLRHGAPVDRWIGSGDSPLHLASKGGYPLLVEAILERGCDINLMNRAADQTALAGAIQYKCVEVAKVLIQHGAAVDIPLGSNKRTALILAAALGRHNIVTHLIDYGSANLEAKDIKGKTALACAVEHRRKPAVSALLTRHANVNTQDERLYTPLHRACQNGDLDIVRMLLKSGANVNAANVDGWTSLHEASRNGDEPIVKLLLKHCAKPDALTEESHSSLFNAARAGHAGQ